MSEKELNEQVEFHADRLDDARRRFHGISIPGICLRCCHSHIFKTGRTNDPTVLCTLNGDGFRVPIDISECNKFSQQGRVSIWDLAKLSNDVDFKTPKLGFKSEEEK